MVIFSFRSGNHGSHLRMSSSNFSLPCEASKTIANAVNCFETDATWNTVAGVLGIAYSRFAIPYPFEKIRESFLTIPTVQPGLYVLSHFLKMSSIFFKVESGIGCALRSIMQKIISAKDKTNRFN